MPSIPRTRRSGTSRCSSRSVESMTAASRSSRSSTLPRSSFRRVESRASAAALREAWEEVGMLPSEARVLGYLPLYYTGTNYLITPVVALVEPSGPFVPNPQEVRSVFEVPLARLMRLDSFSTFRIMRGGKERTSWQITHDGLVIWGITANLTRIFHDTALAGESS